MTAGTRRTPGFLDHFAVWGSLGASLYLMPFGSLLVPALSIEEAVVAAVIAALIAALFVASIAALAARTGRSTLEMLTAPLGDWADIPVGVLLLARHVVIAALALIVMTDAATLIGERALGTDLRPAWAVIFGAGGLALAMLGPQRLAMVMRRAGIWIVLLLAVVIAASAYMEFEVPLYLKRPAVGGWPTIWQAVDVMLIFPLIWLPVVADFARHSDNPRSAARGAFAGFFLFCAWFGSLGIIYLPAVDTGDIGGFLVGMQMSLGALAILFLLQSDELHLNLMSSGAVLEKWTGTTVRRTAAAVPLLIAIPAAIAFNTGEVEQYALLAASVFIPAFGVVIADGLIAGRRSAPIALLAWSAGLVLYQWINPAAITWWQDAIEEPFQFLGLAFPLSGEADWLGAAVPSFLLAFGIVAVSRMIEAAVGLFRTSREPAG